MTDTATTDTPNSIALKPWQRGGPTPNPLGRKRGTPNKFSRAFLADVAEKWHAHGANVLEETRSKWCEGNLVLLGDACHAITREILNHFSRARARVREKSLHFAIKRL